MGVAKAPLDTSITVWGASVQALNKLIRDIHHTREHSLASMSLGALRAVG